MFEKLLKPHTNLASIVLRLTLAAIFLLHGYLDLSVGRLGEWTERLDDLTLKLVTWGEIVGGAALLVGFLSRLASLGLAVIQVGAIILVTGERFINVRLRPKGGPQMDPGFEFNLALIAMCLAVLLLGSGTLALDHFLWRRKTDPPGQAAPELQDTAVPPPK